MADQSDSSVEKQPGAGGPAPFPSPEMLQKLTAFSENREYKRRPSKITLEFCLPEEEEFFEAAIRAMDLQLLLVDLVLWLNAIRYGKPPATPPCPALEPVLRALEAKMEMLGLNN